MPRGGPALVQESHSGQLSGCGSARGGWNSGPVTAGPPTNLSPCIAAAPFSARRPPLSLCGAPGAHGLSAARPGTRSVRESLSRRDAGTSAAMTIQKQKAAVSGGPPLSWGPTLARAIVTCASLGRLFPRSRQLGNRCLSGLSRQGTDPSHFHDAITLLRGFPDGEWKVKCGCGVRGFTFGASTHSVAGT